MYFLFMGTFLEHSMEENLVLTDVRGFTYILLKYFLF